MDSSFSRSPQKSNADVSLSEGFGKDAHAVQPPAFQLKAGDGFPPPADPPGGHDPNAPFQRKPNPLGLTKKDFASEADFRRREKIRLTGLESVMSQLRSGNGVALEACLFRFVDTLEPLITKKMPEMREAAKWSFEDDEDNLQAKVEAKARAYAKAEIEKIPRTTPPSCGDTAKRLRTLFLDEVFVETDSMHDMSCKLQAAHTLMSQAYRNNDEEVDLSTNGSGISSGLGTLAMTKAMRATDQAQMIQVTVEGRGYGHIFTIEQIPRANINDEPQGFLLMSFIGHYGLSSWMGDPKGKVKWDLIELTDEFDDLMNASSVVETNKIYAKLFMLSNKERDWNGPGVVPKINFSFAAAPMNRDKAKEKVKKIKPYD